MIEAWADVPTEEGRMPTFVCHPERGGPFPVVILYMDALGIREELRDMVRRLATVGYHVLLPNLYHRAGLMELNLAEPRLPGDPPRSPVAELATSLTIAMVAQDTRALLAFADTQPAARPGPIGVVGYCMSAQHAINAAAHHPRRVAAAASIYGTWLITDRPDSPHLMARKATAELYFACAEVDHFAPLETIEELRRDFAGNGVEAEIEIYPGVEHGFAFPQRPTYRKAAAERHWERLFALFGRTLGRGE